ncbi:MAG: hypothetical protein KDD70_00820 [Bdellovibrionales bacterium]|nr:hypothetical protein [Bdellovibrionales bacterium]
MTVSASPLGHKTVQLGSNSNNQAGEVPEIVRNNSMIDGAILKSFEESVRSKGLLGDYESGNFYPLWFHYEQERNIQIWRNGYSLSDLSDATVWVDPLALLNKVMQRKQAGVNPLTAPGYFDSGPSDTDDGESNRYFSALGVLLEKALPHLHALSVVAAQCAQSTSVVESLQLILAVGNE